jgi:hypothetical protein
MPRGGTPKDENSPPKRGFSGELSMTRRAAGPSKMYDSFLEGCLGVSPTNNLGDIQGPFGTVP